MDGRLDELVKAALDGVRALKFPDLVAAFVLSALSASFGYGVCGVAVQ